MKHHFFLFIIIFSIFANIALSAEQISFKDMPVQDGICIKMAELKQKGIAVGVSEVTQELYNAIIGENLSRFTGDNLPVNSVSWYDAIVFCNKLCITLGLTPAYSVNGSTNPDDWGYSMHSGASITAGIVEWNKDSDGFRLPTEEEWIYAAKGGRDGDFAGNDDIESCGWYSKNSSWEVHEVMEKEPNGYGLYDTCGNVWEWCWDSYTPKSKFKVLKGGCIYCDKKLCRINFRGHIYPSRNMPNYSYSCYGLRLVRSLPDTEH